MKRFLLSALAVVGLASAVWAAEVGDLSTTDSSNTNGSYGFPEGMAPAAVNDNARAFQGMIARWYQDTDQSSLVSGGITGAVTLTPNRTVSALTDGMVFAFEMGTGVTGSTTLNVNSLGAKTLKKLHDQNLASGDLDAGQKVLVVYDGTADAFQIMSGLATEPDTAIGKHTIWIPAGAMFATATSGASGLTTEQTTAGQPDVNYVAFSASSDEFTQLSVTMPKGWDEGAVAYVPYWSQGGVDTGGVTWSLRGVALGDNDPFGTAFGTAVTVGDTAHAVTEDLMIGPESGNLTIGNSPSEGDIVIFRVGRDTADGSDTLAADAWLTGIKILYTADTPNDD